MKKIAFVKMQALGNDFIVIDGVNQSIGLIQPEILSYLADRHRGIGFDQCLIIEPALSANVDFQYTIFNADGSEVGQCGNGARCAARFIREQGLSHKKILTLATRTTQLKVQIHDEAYQRVTATLGVPHFLSPSPIKISTIPSVYGLTLGNPHAVIRVDDVNAAEVKRIGEVFNQKKDRISRDILNYFPEGVNVGFMQIIDNQHIKLRVFERGVGETLACGSGACAAMICARQFYGASSKVRVVLSGGSLEVEWEGEGLAVSVTGEAQRIFEGVVDLDTVL